MGDEFEKEEVIVPKSYEIVGSREKSVAIVEIPVSLEGEEKKIAASIMWQNKSVKSVLKKSSERGGKLRLRKYEMIEGDPNTEVNHREYGYELRVDPQKAYFSPREASERQRIASQAKSGEMVLVMFSGIAPLPIAIAKRQTEVRKVYGIELNRIAHEYGIYNVRINKLGHKITLIHGDVKEVCKGYHGKFDRIVMPLPMGAENFLETAVTCLKEDGIIHFYSWGKEDDLFSNALKLIEEGCNRLGKKCEVLSKRKVLPYSPRKWKVCIEFKVKRGSDSLVF